jgi:putative phosphoesterase
MEPQVHRIGVIADTHVPSALHCLPDSLATALAGVDHIVHAGDLVSLSVLDELNAIAPTTAVVGNCDPPEVARHLPARATLEVAGRRVGIQHGHQSHFLQNQYVARGYSAPEFDLF